MGDTTARTRFENVLKLSNDPLLARGNTLRSGEDRLKLNELMKLCTNLQTRVLDLEKTKTTQANEIDNLKRRVKRLEKKKRPRTHKLKRLYKVGLTAMVESSGDVESLGEDASKQGRINAIDVDEDITLVNDQDDADMFDVNTLTVLAALKSVKPKEKANVVEERSVPVSAASTKVSDATTTTTATILTLRKGIVITELGTSTTITTISSQPSQAKTAREKDEANVALTEEWDDIQAKVNADYQLVQRLQAQEQEELTDEEKARLFVQFLEQRRKHFAAKRVEEKRNKPPTQAQQRKIMCTYLKNMEGKKPKDLKNKSFDSIQKMFDKAFKRQKVDDVQEIAELDDDQEADKIKELMEIVPDKEEVAIDAIPLAINLKHIFSHTLKSFDREDLETMWKLVKSKHGSTRPVEGYERVLWDVLEIYMLVEKKYHLTPATITDMLNKKLQCRIVGNKRLLDDLRVTAAQVCVTSAKLKLVLFINFNEKYAN
ncbi:hypothetical protein Tco_1308623 [Tanacetum coccineum]